MNTWVHFLRESVKVVLQSRNTFFRHFFLSLSKNKRHFPLVFQKYPNKILIALLKCPPPCGCVLCFTACLPVTGIFRITYTLLYVVPIFSIKSLYGAWHNNSLKTSIFIDGGYKNLFAAHSSLDNTGDWYYNVKRKISSMLTDKEI